MLHNILFQLFLKGCAMFCLLGVKEKFQKCEKAG